MRGVWRIHRIGAASLVLGATLLGPGRACADFIWTGDALDGLWTTGGNWDGGVAPDLDLAGMGLTFGPTGIQQFPNAGDDDWTNIGFLNFTGADAELIIFGSGSLSFVDGAAITNDSTEDQSIIIDLVATGSSLVLDAQTANLTFGAIDLSDTSGVDLSVIGASDTIINGIISGAGGRVIKQGAGTLTLAGDNTYDGGTELNAGTIILGHDNALGTGALTLTGDGTLESDDDARSVANDIDNGGNLLTVAGASDLALSGVISGAGGLTLTGSGTLTLGGDSTYTGPTNINNGTLRLNGSIDSLVNVNSGGTLSGSGSMLGDLTNFSGGSVTPGDGVGTFTVDGNYDQQAGSTLGVQLNDASGTSDLLDVTGTSTLAASSTVDVSLVGTGFLTDNQTITLIQSAGGITDSGATITDASATIDFIRDPTFVNGNTTWGLQVLRAANAYSAAATAGTNRTIGTALDSLIATANAAPNSAIATLLGRLDSLDSATYNAAVGHLSPEPYNAVTGIALDNASAFTSEQANYLAAKRLGIESRTVEPLTSMHALRGSLAAASHDATLLAAAAAQVDWLDDPARPQAEDERSGSYIKLRVLSGDQDTSAGRTGFDASSFGIQAGADYRWTHDLTAGLAVGYSFTTATLDGQLGDVNAHTIRAGPYASLTSGAWYLDGSMTYAYSYLDSTRTNPTLSLTADGDYSAYDVTAYLGTGLHLEVEGDLRVTPMASVQYSYLQFDGFSESGASGADLSVARRTTDSLRTRAGAQLSTRVDMGALVFPHLFAGWDHEFFDDDPIQASFAGGGSAFVIDTGRRASDSIFFGAGVSVLLDPNVSAFVRYEKSIADDGGLYGLSGGFSLAF